MKFDSSLHGGTGELHGPLMHTLILTYNRQVFPRQINTRPVHKDSVVSKIKERRKRLKELAANGGDGSGE